MRSWGKSWCSCGASHKDSFPRGWLGNSESLRGGCCCLHEREPRRSRQRRRRRGARGGGGRRGRGGEATSLRPRHHDRSAWEKSSALRRTTRLSTRMGKASMIQDRTSRDARRRFGRRVSTARYMPCTTLVRKGDDPPQRKEFPCQRPNAELRSSWARKVRTGRF